MALPTSKTLSVVITTKNRWSDLERTLNALSKDYPQYPVLIIDDGSEQRPDSDLTQLHPRVEIETASSSVGLIVRRNQLAQAAQTPYVLSLDDDSYPVSGQFDEVTSWMDDNVDVLCSSLPIFNPIKDSFQNAPRGEAPSTTRGFFGCAHIMRRSAFIDLGAYNDELIHQGEEMDLGARGVLDGQRCVHFPGALIHHLESNEGRNWTRMDYYGARNAVLWNDWYVPTRLQRVRSLRRAAATTVHAAKTRRLGQIKGHLAARQLRPSLQHYRKRFDEDMFRRWLALPFA